MPSKKKHRTAKPASAVNQKKRLRPRDPRPGYSLIGLYAGPIPKGFSSDNHDEAFGKEHPQD